ncbi:hypothetical protein GCM10009648_05140 [Tsukamurella spumae]
MELAFLLRWTIGRIQGRGSAACRGFDGAPPPPPRARPVGAETTAGFSAVALVASSSFIAADAPLPNRGAVIPRRAGDPQRHSVDSGTSRMLKTASKGPQLLQRNS